MKKSKVLFDNRSINYDEWYSFYEEYCLDNDIICKDRESNDFYEWVGETLNMDWDDFFTNLKYDKDNNCECVVLGSLGLWYGRREIQANFVTLKEALYKCVGCGEYITISENNGVIEVIVSHHDGTNYFDIHKLNKKGIELVNKELLYKKHYHKRFNIQY